MFLNFNNSSMAKDKDILGKIQKLLKDENLIVGDLRGCSRTLNFFIKVNKLKGETSVILDTVLKHVDSLVKIIDRDYEKSKK